MESFRGPETQVLRAKYRGPETQVLIMGHRWRRATFSMAGAGGGQGRAGQGPNKE